LYLSLESISYNYCKSYSYFNVGKQENKLPSEYNKSDGIVLGIEVDMTKFIFIYMYI
jgi:hypothetical protein